MDFWIHFSFIFKGFEPYAFQNAKKLFDTIEIPIIFMEWLNLPQQTDAYKEIQAMIDFLLSFKLKPFSGNQMLDIDNKRWLSWPGDISWKKDGY